MPAYKKLFEILAGVKNAHEMDKLLHELLTPKELQDIWRRWQIIEDLHHGMPQREIAERHKMSLCKITRGAKVLRAKDSICKQILEQGKKR